MINHLKLSDQCGGFFYRYIFEYDDVQLVANTRLQCTDIQGVVCEGCLTNFIKSYVCQNASPPGTGGAFTVEGDSGAIQTIESDDNLRVIGDGEIYTSTNATDQLHIGITPSPTDNFYLATIDGVVQWAPVSGGITIDALTFAADSGPDQTVVLGDTVTFIGDGVVNTIAAATDEIHIEIGPGTDGQVLSTVAGAVVWATPSGGGGPIDPISFEADTGPAQAVSPGDNITFIGDGVINTIAAATREVHVEIGAGGDGEVLTSFGGVAAWALPSGGDFVVIDGGGNPSSSGIISAGALTIVNGPGIDVTLTGPAEITISNTDPGSGGGGGMTCLDTFIDDAATEVSGPPGCVEALGFSAPQTTILEIDNVVPVSPPPVPTGLFRFRILPGSNGQVLTTVAGAPAWANPSGNFVAVPANNSAPGAAGDYAGDANFAYLCIATNSWVRWPVDPTF